MDMLRTKLRAAVVIGAMSGLQPIWGQASQNGITDPSKANPISMTECEGVNNCATWTFLGETGNGKWPSGSEANLNVTSHIPNHVVIERSDSTGSTAGKKVTYAGERRGTSIAGWYTSSDTSGKTPTSGPWYATIETNAAGIPGVMWNCTVNHTAIAWTWNGSTYIGSNADTGESIAGTRIDVTHFTPESVILRRVQPGAHADMVGKVSSEGNSLEGTGVWHTDDGKSWEGPMKMFWGTARPKDCSAPRQVQQQSSVIVVSPVIACVPWFFGMICAN